MRKLFSVLTAIIFAFSITIFADVGKTVSATSTKSAKSQTVALAPFTQTVIAVNSVAESRRICEPPLISEIAFLQFENADFKTTKTNYIFDNSINLPPEQRKNVKRGKANIRSPDAGKEV